MSDTGQGGGLDEMALAWWQAHICDENIVPAIAALIEQARREGAASRDAEVERLRSALEAVEKQRDEINFEWIKANSARAEAEQEAARLTQEITRLHGMLQGAWALLPPEDGERLGIAAEMRNCERPDCTARAALSTEPEE